MDELDCNEEARATHTLDGVLGHGALKSFLLGKFPRERVTLEGAPDVPGFTLVLWLAVWGTRFSMSLSGCLSESERGGVGGKYSTRDSKGEECCCIAVDVNSEPTRKEHPPLIRPGCLDVV